MICTSRQSKNHISRRFYSPISPDKSSKFFCFLRTFIYSSKLWSSYSCFHPCRTHRSWSDAYFHTVCSCLNQRSRSFCSNDVSCNYCSVSTKLLSKLFDHIYHRFLISMCSIENKSSNTKRIKSGYFFIKRIYSNSDS